MIFTLEALEAKHGDSLLLHYGAPNDPQLIVIDGGPSGVFDKTLRPRLEQLKAIRSPAAPLPIRLMMVSHIDDDHIKGILELTIELLEQREAQQPLLCDITTLWHNSFDEILGNNQTGAIAASLGSAVRLSAAGELTFPPGLFRDHSPAAVAANVPQGRRLRDNASALALLPNDPFENLVVLPQDDKEPLEIDDNLKFTIVGPSQARLEKLQIDWDKKLKKLLEKPPAEARAQAAEFIDKSVYNLSSIVVLAEVKVETEAEAKAKQMLLTGDGLSADILAGLKEAGLLQEGGKLHVDLLKMPHHGSMYNNSEEFLTRVTADHYVISASGKHHHPDTSTLELISKIRGADEYTIHLTNPVPTAVEFYAADRQKPDKNYKVEIREDPARSVRINLGEPFND